VQVEADKEGRLRRATTYVRENYDALLVAVGAAVVFALDLVSKVDKETVGSATLALLGVTAIVLLRDRAERALLLEFRERANGALGNLDALNRLASDSLSELPFEVLSQVCVWDIFSRDRSAATSTLRIRFTRGGVSTMEGWYSGQGELCDWRGYWKYPGEEQWNEAKGIHSLEVEAGTKKIFALGREHSRGDVIDWHARREAVGQFPAHSESVSVLPLDPNVDHPRQIKVFWPPGVTPTSVFLRYRSRTGIPLSPSSDAGNPPRLYVEQYIEDLARQGSAELGWIW
jgi:hypothetical protein